MAKKTKTFKSNHDGPIVVAVPGREPVAFEPGKTHETDEQDVIAALAANSDLAEVKPKK